MDYSKKIRSIIEGIVTEYDEAQRASLEGGEYDYLLSGDGVDKREVLDCFERNYSAKTFGLIKYDDLTAHELRWAVGDDALLKLIFDNSSVLALDDIYIQHNEMNSFSIGEYEHQIDVQYHPELEAAFAAAGIDEESIIEYGRPCERLILKLDPTAFLKAYAKLISANKKRPKLVLLKRA